MHALVLFSLPETSHTLRTIGTRTVQIVLDSKLFLGVSGGGYLFSNPLIRNSFLLEVRVVHLLPLLLSPGCF